MSFGDFSFIAAFVVFPLVIVAASIWALRTLGRRERRPLARFSAGSPAESTQEMPIAERIEPRDWVAAVRPTRGPTSQEESERSVVATQSFKLPTYRGRSTGVVRRVALQTRAGSRRTEVRAADETDAR